MAGLVGAGVGNMNVECQTMGLLSVALIQGKYGYPEMMSGRR
jgi:hypothetical protein